MASMYDSVTPGGMIDTVFGNWKPNQNKSALTAIKDGVSGMTSSSPSKPLDARTRMMVENPGLALGMANFGKYVAAPAANSVGKSLAEQDYADSHGGTYPASPEELSAYISYSNGSNSGGALANQNNQPQAQPTVENGLNTSAPQGSVPGALGMGNDDPAQNQVQEQQNKARASVNAAKAASGKLVSQGYTPPPSAKDDPAGYMAAVNSNKAKGVGGASGDTSIASPPPPTESQAQSMALNQAGKAAAFDMSKQPPWYKSQSFNYGLVSFGLNLLSGNDLATSFNAAAGAFTDMYGSEQRGQWAQDLANQGYSRQEIEEYVRTGNSKALTDPMEKQAQQVQLQTNLAQLNNLQYNNSSEMRQRTLDREDRKDSLDELKARSSIANDNARLGIAYAGLKLKQDAASGSGEQPIFYNDTNGKQYEVLRNARGTPLINANGMASVRDTDSGEVTWRNISDNQRQMGGIQANEGLHALDQFEQGGLLKFTGNSMIAKGERYARDQVGQNVTSNLSSQISNLNGSMRAALETQLMQENNNRPVQKYMLDTAVKRLGQLDINAGPEENARVLSNYRSVLNSQYHARNETHPTVDNRNYNNASRPGVTYDGSRAGSGNGPYVGQSVNGRVYMGGDPTLKSSWK